MTNWRLSLNGRTANTLATRAMTAFQRGDGWFARLCASTKEGAKMKRRSRVLDILCTTDSKDRPTCRLRLIPGTRKRLLCMPLRTVATWLALFLLIGMSAGGVTALLVLLLLVVAA